MEEERRRGRLTVYLGAAPGVGKTYAMLGEAHRRLARGTDIVVGYVEPHGRANTLAQVEGLEVVPRQKISYRGTTFTEMDTAAVIARRPGSPPRPGRASRSGCRARWCARARRRTRRRAAAR